MTAEPPPTAFSLVFHGEPEDLMESLPLEPNLRKRRERAIVSLGFYLPAVIAATAITVRLDLARGAPFWLYIIDVIGWLLLIRVARFVYMTKPKRLALRSCKAFPDFTGVHHIEINTDGLTAVDPRGTEEFTPWSLMGSLQETARAFYLFSEDGQLQGVIPKRGLADPAVLPALRNFLYYRGETAAAGPAAPSAGPADRSSDR